MTAQPTDPTTVAANHATRSLPAQPDHPDHEGSTMSSRPPSPRTVDSPSAFAAHLFDRLYEGLDLHAALDEASAPFERDIARLRAHVADRPDALALIDNLEDAYTTITTDQFDLGTHFGMAVEAFRHTLCERVLKLPARGQGSST